MGLITGLLTLPLAPVRGVAWVAEQVADQAEQELYDEGRIMREMAAVELAHDAGEIDDEALEAHQDLLLQRLEQGRRIREWRATNNG
jgi:DNA-binding GntR family transcriptional regulator